MSRPSAAFSRAADSSARAEAARRRAPQLDIVSSVSVAEASLPAAAVAAGASPSASPGGVGILPKRQASPALSIAIERGAVALDLIDVASDRMRARDADWEALIASTYGEVGQLQPIRLVREASGRFTLDGFGFGVTRLEAARLAGWTTVEAEWCERADVDPRFYRLPEIIEQIARRRLGALDECRFLAEYKAIHLRLYPEAANGGNRKGHSEQKQGLDHQNAKFAFWSVASENTGLGRRAVEMKVAIWEGLGAAARDRLAGSRLADNQSALQQLSALAYGLQDRVLDLLLAVPAGAATIADAIELALGKRLPSIDDKRFNSVAGNMQRLSAAARRPLWTAYADEIIPVLKAEGLI
jgi:hypothetical protein